MTCDGFLAGTCKKVHELVPSKKAFSLMPVPNELQQRWKAYGDACAAWGTSNPMQAKGKANGGGKGDPK